MAWQTLHASKNTVLCYHPYLVSMLLADLLSLHLVTFLMFFSLVLHIDLKLYNCVQVMIAIDKDITSPKYI